MGRKLFLAGAMSLGAAPNRSACGLRSGQLGAANRSGSAAARERDDGEKTNNAFNIILRGSAIRQRLHPRSDLLACQVLDVDLKAGSARWRHFGEMGVEVKSRKRHRYNTIKRCSSRNIRWMPTTIKQLRIRKVQVDLTVPQRWPSNYRDEPASSLLKVDMQNERVCELGTEPALSQY
jgi:hypothetical protein